MGGQKGVRRGAGQRRGERVEQIAIRLPEGLLRRLDRHVERLRGQVPQGVGVSRADAARSLLLDALGRIEARKG